MCVLKNLEFFFYVLSVQIGLVGRYGYPAEEHYVTTEDGYNLVIHRVPGSPLFNGRRRRTVVFLQHGILCTSDCWVAGAGKDLRE